MANTPGSDNPFPSVLFAEHVDPATPPAGTQRLFVDTDHVLKLIDENDVVSDVSGGTIADILDLPTSETTTTKVLAPDGAGGVEFRAESGGSGATAAINQMSSSVTMTNANQFYDGPSLSLVAGTYVLIGVVNIFTVATVTPAYFAVKLWDGTTVIAQVEVRSDGPTTEGWVAVPVTGYVVLSGSATWKISVSSSVTNNSVIKKDTNYQTGGNTASSLVALKIA